MHERIITFHLHSCEPIGQVETFTITFKDGTKTTYNVSDYPKVDSSTVEEFSFSITKKEKPQ